MAWPVDWSNTNKTGHPQQNRQPLVDLNGAVIGINSAIASLSSGASGESGSIGVGFAIPIDQAKRICRRDHSDRQRLPRGARCLRRRYQYGPESVAQHGATISARTAGGSAQAAGLAVGDVITKVGEQQIESAEAPLAAVRSAPRTLPSTSPTPGDRRRPGQRDARIVHQLTGAPPGR